MLQLKHFTHANKCFLHCWFGVKWIWAFTLTICNFFYCHWETAATRVASICICDNHVVGVFSLIDPTQFIKLSTFHWLCLLNAMTIFAICYVFFCRDTFGFASFSNWNIPLKDKTDVLNMIFILLFVTDTQWDRGREWRRERKLLLLDCLHAVNHITPKKKCE